jgi:hypothetical protein
VQPQSILTLISYIIPSLLYCCPSLVYSDSIHDSVIDSIKKASETFPGAVAILSNSVGSADDIGFAGAMRTEEAFSLPVIRHLKKKPDCLAEVNGINYLPNYLRC